MLATYQRLEAEGKIGKFLMGQDGQLEPRPYTEYPKWITSAGGTRVIVNSQREELARASEPSPDLPPDPIVSERNELRATVNDQANKLETQGEQLSEAMKLLAEMRAQLDALAGGPAQARMDASVLPGSSEEAEIKVTTERQGEFKLGELVRRAGTAK